jgi:hypothetical protein
MFLSGHSRGQSQADCFNCILQTICLGFVASIPLKPLLACPMRYLILCSALVGSIASASLAKQVNPPYSLEVKWATEQSGNHYEHPVYVWPYVKSPGAYPFKSGMTVSDLITIAGGLIEDSRYPNKSWAIPHTVGVKRASPVDPDPTTSIYKCGLDWAKPDRGLSRACSHY